MPLPKKYKEKYSPKKSEGEKVTAFMFKVMGLLGVFTFFAIGADVYHIFF